MPAPEAAIMQQVARTTFMSFGLVVPPNWQEPTGDAGDQYRRALKPEERMTAPGVPPLFRPASLSKYHTDTQKMMIANVGNFFDKSCQAICSAWAQWQSTATFAGFVVAGPVVTVGVLTGPPLGPLILAQMPTQSGIFAMQFASAVANTIGSAFMAWSLTVKSPGLPFYPAYSAVAVPVAPPTPNIPFPLAAFTSAPNLMAATALKAQMIAALGRPDAPHHPQMFEALATAVEASFMTWIASTTVNNVLAVASGGTPVSPIPAVGTATMLAGGLL